MATLAVAAAPSGGAGGGSSGPRSKHTTVVIGGNTTDIIQTIYHDRVFIVVTQMGKMGTMIEARAEGSVQGGPAPGFTIKTLLGVRNNEMLEVLARQLIQTISKRTTRPLLLSVALKDLSLDAVRAVLKAVLDNRLF